MLVSIISLAGASNPTLAALGPLRVLRALRPLRLVNRYPQLKVLVTALVVSVPAVCQIGAIFILVYLIFAIFFTSFLKGQLRSCQGSIFDDSIAGGTDYDKLLVDPKPWSSMTDEQQSWFMPNSPVNEDISVLSACRALGTGVYSDEVKKSIYAM